MKQTIQPIKTQKIQGQGTDDSQQQRKRQIITDKITILESMHANISKFDNIHRYIL